MNINLSDETIKTIVDALSTKKRILERRLVEVEISKASKDMKPVYESALEKVKDALQVFEEV